MANRAGHEARRRAVIRIGEIDLGRMSDVTAIEAIAASALIGVERGHQRFETAHLDGAGDLELLADQPRQIDVEALRIAVRPGELNGG